MRKILIIVMLLLTVKGVKAQEIPVFVGGQSGYESFRIPAIIKTLKGDLLAFCEGRVAGAGDFGNIDIVMKRSQDNGKTWSKLQEVVDYGDLQAGNPAPVVDLTDPQYPQGRTFLFYNTGNNHEGEIRNGKGMREVWYVASTDEGQTWTEPVNITTQVHRPNQQKLNADYNFIEDWRSYANTPGHAMQFDSGKYSGRIFVSANHSAGKPKPAFQDYQAHGYYTDDHGKTFRLSENIPLEGSNESMAAQITGDNLLMNSRNQQGNKKNRIISISGDGGASWDTSFYDLNLPDPVNQGSIISFIEKGRRILFFCNANSSTNRDSLTLRASRNDGKTWFFNKLIAAAPVNYKGGYTAYSDVVNINKREVGVLFEKDNYKQIVFVPIKWR